MKGVVSIYPLKHSEKTLPRLAGMPTVVNHILDVKHMSDRRTVFTQSLMHSLRLLQQIQIFEVGRSAHRRLKLHYVPSRGPQNPFSAHSFAIAVRDSISKPGQADKIWTNLSVIKQVA